MEKIKTGKLQKAGIVVGILTGITVFLSLLIGGVWVVFDWVDNKNDFQSTQTEINTNQIKINLIIEDNAKGIANNAKGIANNAEGIANNAKGIADNAKGIASNAKGIANNAKVLKKIEKYIIELRQKKEQSVKTEAEKEGFYSKKQQPK